MLCVGAGGLGSPAALYLAAAGIGTLGIIDFDAVDASNLQRQILHGTPDVGRSKLQSARDRLIGAQPRSPHRDLRDGADVRERARALPATTTSSSTAPTISRRGISSTTPACCSGSRTPTAASSGSRVRHRCSRRRAGRATAACIPSRRRPGSCRAAPKVACSACCPESSARFRRPKRIKLILGGGSTLVGRLLLYDAWNMKFRELKLRRDPACPVCGDHPTVKGADRLRPVLRHHAAGGRCRGERRPAGTYRPFAVPDRPPPGRPPGRRGGT